MNHDNDTSVDIMTAARRRNDDKVDDNADVIEYAATFGALFVAQTKPSHRSIRFDLPTADKLILASSKLTH